MRGRAFGFLSTIGRSLMLPVAVLPVAGLLLGIGSAQFDVLPPLVSALMKQAGGAIFDHLPLLFAIAVALGFTRNDAVSAISAAIGYMVMLATLGGMARVWGVEPVPIMGIPSMETGVFGGILAGALAAFLFNRFHRIALPQYLAFFAGKRFVPIVTALAAILLGVVLSAGWPPIQAVIDRFSHWAAVSDPSAAAALYGVVERLLIPFGLHHIWNVPFFFEIGAFTDAAGHVVHGDIARFFAGDPTAGVLGGAYFFKMFGLPGAAIAMWRSALPQHRLKVGGIMISGALTSFVTGITEPIEFAFLFAAPALYLLHAGLAATTHLVAHALDMRLGFTFSQGGIDLVAFNLLGANAHGAWLVPVVGPLYGLVYYGVFRWAVARFDLKTPGRDDDEAAAPAVAAADAPGRSQDLVAAFGGEGNIVGLDACITRLRISVKDGDKVNPERLRALGASGVVIIGGGVQAVFGPASETIKADMEEYLRSGGGEAQLPPGRIEAAAQLARIAQDHGSLKEDLAQSRDRERELERNLERGRRLANLGAVVAGVAHDLRNPITGIKLTLDGLARRSLDDRSAADVTTCKDELARLDRLVGSLLLVARSGASGKVDIDLGQLVDERFRKVETVAAERGVTLEREGAASAAGNLDAVVRVIDNLLRNAIEASPDGGRVRVRVEPAIDETRVVVEDVGPGVPPHCSHELFEPFFTLKPDGVGLGLFLSRALAEAQGGRLSYARVAQTTTFTVALPRARPEQADAAHLAR